MRVKKQGCRRKAIFASSASLRLRASASPARCQALSPFSKGPIRNDTELDIWVALR